MNISRSKGSSISTGNPSTISEAKAVLKAARLLRLQSISPSSSYDSYSLLRSKRKNKQRNKEEECRSFRSSICGSSGSSSSSDKNVDLVPSSFARIHDKNCVSTNDDINDVLQELKQIKQNIAKEIHITKDIDSNLRTRIHSFMEACNLALKEFDRRPEHDTVTSYSYEQKQQQNLDGKKKISMLRRKSSLRNKFPRERSLSTTSYGSSSTVRFDLSQNEFFD